MELPVNPVPLGKHFIQMPIFITNNWNYLYIYLTDSSIPRRISRVYGPLQIEDSGNASFVFAYGEPTSNTHSEKQRKNPLEP